jgi:UDP-glucose 4-epimerase
VHVLVTGAAGTLGEALIPVLVARGDNVTAVDVRKGSAEAEWLVADIREPRAIADPMRGVDIVVHAAAIHGIHLRSHSDRDFYDLNVTGTFNVWQAAVAARVRGVVFSSTMGVYGESRVPLNDKDVVFVDENLPLLPGDIYGWTKVVGEQMCRLHLRRDRVPSIALRYGMFVPEPMFRYGIRLLYGGVHEADVAEAVLLAVDALADARQSFRSYNVESPLPFTPDDAADLRRDPLSVVDRHWPGAADFLRARGVRSLKPITEVFRVDRLREELGWRPRHDFGVWLDELRGSDDQVATAEPPWP